jgi:Mg-chelatase subunit ChlD
LNKGLDLLRRMLPQWRNRYPVMDLVILSDGRSTGPMMGLQVDRALGVVRKFTREVAVVNPIPAAEPFARDLAKRLGAGYLED